MSRKEEVDPRRGLPSVHSLLDHDEVAAWIGRWGRAPVTSTLQAVLARHRDVRSLGGPQAGEAQILADVLRTLEAKSVSLRPIINATGVILHTNLGRAPLSEEAAEAAAMVAVRYSSLEYDVETGRRGDRYEHCTALICRLTGSDASLVVNNNAAAVSLAINELARGRDVIISRGELVEIGGGFRIPEVIERSGGFLAAVGTTNRTRIDDYRRAITPSTGLLLKVHPSNYRVDGFTEDTPLSDLVELGRRAGLPVMYDLGSGLILPETLSVSVSEPPPSRSVASGADLITWSGDKLLGGPQAGVLHGSEVVIDRLRRNPLLRAFRVDKMTLAALEATLRLYLDPETAVHRIPALRMLAEAAESVRQRARATHVLLEPGIAARVVVAPMRSVVGGGAAPGVELESAGWTLDGPAERLDALLRGLDPPVISRIGDDTVHIDFRTLLPGDEEAVARGVSEALSVVRDER
jgi:L-seryl-tRNA(Ser) seleniumtransferase